MQLLLQQQVRLIELIIEKLHLSRQMQAWQIQDLTGSYQSAIAQECGTPKLILCVLAIVNYLKGKVLGIKQNEKITKLFPLKNIKGIANRVQCTVGL